MMEEKCPLTEEDKKIIRFIQTLDIKEKLLTYEVSDLLECYADEDSFKDFILGLGYLLDDDEDFLKFIPIFIDDIESFLAAKRFTITDKELIQQINSIICRLNMLKNDSFEEQLVDAVNYIDKQNQWRGQKFKSVEMLTDSMIADMDIIMALLDDEEASHLANNMFFLASTNYFVQAVPELYDEDLVKFSLDKCDIIAKKSKLFDAKTKQYVKKTKEKLRKV